MASPTMITIPPPLHSIAKTLASMPYHIRTVYLFTAADFSTFAIPTTLFATFASLCGSPLTTNDTPSLLPILARMPLALVIIWSNLLLFNISNQRSPVAIEEDRVNKPHRPLPSGRLTSEDARRTLLVATPAVMLLSLGMGVWEECLLLLAFTWLYNDLGGCDEHWVLRNLLIAIGYGLYSSAALRVMAGPYHTITPQGLEWIGVVTGVMFATQHICDIKDAEGDKLRGRRSAPIVLGDTCVRWSVAVPIVLCSAACPWFFELGLPSFAVTCSIGAYVAFRALLFRDLQSDRATWKLWALWTSGLFALPLVSNPDALGRACLDARMMMWDMKCALCCGESCAGLLDLAAVSGIAMVFEGRRIYSQAAFSHPNQTAPKLIVEGVVG